MDVWVVTDRQGNVCAVFEREEDAERMADSGDKRGYRVSVCELREH